MRRCFYLLPLLIFSIASFAFSSNDLIYGNQILSAEPTTTPTPVQVEESDLIVLDKKVVCHPCPPRERCRPEPECPVNNTGVIISVSAVIPENNQLKYKYTVSGGRVIGKGANVSWNLTGTQPGTYQIRVDIEDELTGKKQTETEIITVSSISIADCLECPILTVDASTSLTKAGETVTFIANVSGGGASNVTYNWKVSTGEIIEGQGTPVIKVATTAKMAGKTVKATVEIEGVCDECLKTESAEASIAATKIVKKKN